jgi:hypothetical protein
MLRILALIAALALLPQAALAQGSTGGSIGKQGKSVSGSEEAPAPRRSEPAEKRRSVPVKRTAAAPTSGRRGCGSFLGTWSWTGGLFGPNDTVFLANGTATHKSGIPGTWECRDGDIYIDWKNWAKNRVRLSPDGKTLQAIEGGYTFVR